MFKGLIACAGVIAIGAAVLALAAGPSGAAQYSVAKCSASAGRIAAGASGPSCKTRQVVCQNSNCQLSVSVTVHGIGVASGRIEALNQYNPTGFADGTCQRYRHDRHGHALPTSCSRVLHRGPFDPTNPFQALCSWWRNTHSAARQVRIDCTVAVRS
jgi:hypothetical protein